jgi:hypothetical protein
VADLSDVTAYLATQVASAVYPNGDSQPSVAAMDCLIYEGWPIPDALDLDLAGNIKSAAGVVVPRAGGPRANVSIFPMQGTGVNVYQIQDETYTIVPVSYGMSVTQNGNTITVSGQPNAGEYLTLVCDDRFVYSLSGANTAALLAALATAAQANYPSASSTSTTLTVPTSRSLIVRQGGIGTLGKVTHRQRHSVMVTVWAPTRVARSALASAIDVALKENIRVAMPDTSQALVIYSRTNVSDEQQSTTIYRRDLVYEVEYATLQTFPGNVITTVNTTVTAIGTITNANAAALT